MRVLLLTPSVFYSLLSHYQVAPQLPGKWYIQKSQAMAQSCHKTCLQSAALHHYDHYLVNTRQYLVDTFPRFSPLLWSRISGFWVSGEAGVKSRPVWARARTNLRPERPEPEPGQWSSALRVGSTWTWDFWNVSITIYWPYDLYNQILNNFRHSGSRDDHFSWKCRRTGKSLQKYKYLITSYSLNVFELSFHICWSPRPGSLSSAVVANYVA